MLFILSYCFLEKIYLQLLLVTSRHEYDNMYCYGEILKTSTGCIRYDSQSPHRCCSRSYLTASPTLNRQNEIFAFSHKTSLFGPIPVHPSMAYARVLVLSFSLISTHLVISIIYVCVPESI